MRELGGDRILIDRHGYAAEALRRKLRPIEARAIVADHRQLVAAAEAMRGETERKIAHFLEIPGPIVGLPDAAVLFAQRRPFAHRPSIADQQARQGRADRHSAASLRSLVAPR